MRSMSLDTVLLKDEELAKDQLSMAKTAVVKCCYVDFDLA